MYAVVSFQYIGIIARQNICRLISGCTVFHECVNRIFPKSDLALKSTGRDVKRLNVSLSRTLLNRFDFYLFYDVYGLDLIQVNLFTPYLDELHGQHDNNIPACFVFPLQKFQIMLKELFSI